MKNRYFSFGKNWKSYVLNVVNEDVIEEAKQSLLKFLPPDKYKGKTFIDVGCGSGLFSVAAILLGCGEVISFDLDKLSLEALEILKIKFNKLIPSDKDWKIFSGSILDLRLVDNLKDSADIVYAWGVLHHTGQMQKAIENTTQLVKSDGYLIIAIYNRVPTSYFWKRIKKLYNDLPFLRPLLICGYGSLEILWHIFKTKKLNLHKERGMHIFYDVIDWLGGYPYEFATSDEVKYFVERLGFKLLKMPTEAMLENRSAKKIRCLFRVFTGYTGNNEFLFKRIN